MTCHSSAGIIPLPSVLCPLPPILRFTFHPGDMVLFHTQAGEKQYGYIANAMSPLPLVHEILRRTNLVLVRPSAGHSEGTLRIVSLHCD